MSEQLRGTENGFESHSLRQTPVDSVAVAPANGETPAKTAGFLYPKFTPKPFDRKTYQRQWMADRRKYWFAANGPCSQCGSSENLELDHVDPATKVSHKIWSWSKVRREAETAKCRVLCRACHIARHAAERIVHGMQRYRAGCRCAECISGMRASKARWYGNSKRKSTLADRQKTMREQAR